MTCMQPVISGKFEMSVEEKLRQYLHDEMGFSVSDTVLKEIIDNLNREKREFDDFEAFANVAASRFAVNETYFLRHQDQFAWMENQWLPVMMQRYREGDTVRILSAGCSSGEEPYSVYAHLAPALEKKGIKLVVDAVDICRAALQKAVAARYGLWSMRGVDIKNEQSWLEIQSRQVLVKDWVKNAVDFSSANITRPFLAEKVAQYDLILCRNVMIYMHQEAFRQVYRNLCVLLKPLGLVMPGPSDPGPGKDSPLIMRFDRNVRLLALDEKAFCHQSDNKILLDDVDKSASEKEKIIIKKVAERLLAERQPDVAVKTEQPAVSMQQFVAKDYNHVHDLIRACQYQSARSCLEAILDIDPMDTRAYVMLAMMALELDDHVLARMATRKAYFLDPDAPYVSYLRADYFSKCDDRAGEIKALKMVLNLLKNIDDDLVVKFSEDLTAGQLKGAVYARLG